MRLGFLLALGCLSLAGAQLADKLAMRYGFDVLEDVYPQQTPAEALKSVVKAIADNRVNYLLAHLADPRFVDKKVADYKNQFEGKEEARVSLAFERLVKETTKHFRDDPLLIQELKQFAKEGQWKMDNGTASASVKTVPGQQVFMRKLQNRWFLENRR